MSTTTQTTPSADVAPDGAGARSGIRTDIQGLRALAVSLVLVYHVAPKALSGGFIGVDVFFVISGFLITSHLLQRPPGTARDLASFWSRRIRRLLPASLLVLLTTLVATRLVGPETQWENTARQGGAATVYVVNWLLARDAVDYLAAENAATPVQHFWSLSVEEQFYFVWPIAILVLVLLARRSRWGVAAVVGAGLTAGVAASLAYSVHETATNPAAAYFVTPTRMWELGLGGLLALATAPGVLGRTTSRRPGPEWSMLLGYVGLVAIAWSAVTYSGSTPFPGWRALVPVLGTVLVIAGHAPPGGGRFTPGRLLALRPVQWLGDASYSVYLWHWPLIVLVGYVSGRLGDLDRLGIVVASLVLAGLTKTYVEDRFRSARWGTPLRKPYLLGASGMVVVLLVAGAMVAEVHHRDAASRARLQRALADGAPCFGAAALEPGRDCPEVSYSDVLPSPAEASRDKSDAYGDISGRRDCWSSLPHFPVRQCVRGAASADVRVALVGNSHAGQWLPALERLAKRHHWRIETHLASRCAFVDIDQAFPTAAQSQACSHWVEQTKADLVQDPPDLVVLTNRISAPAAGRTLEQSASSYRRGYVSTLRDLGDAGVRTLVLHDTPFAGFPIPDCVAGKAEGYRACDGSRTDWVPDEPAEAAVRAVDSDRIRFADLTDHICDGPTCRAVTGGVITYFDGSHLTATYAATLAPYLDRPIGRLLAG